MSRRSQPTRNAKAEGGSAAASPALRAWLFWISIVAILLVFGCSSAARAEALTIVAPSGGSQSAATGSKFANPPVIKVTGGNNDPVSEVFVTFGVPSSGASASQSSSTGTTVSDGTASVTVTAKRDRQFFRM
ncbi:MAG: hypothetical protein WCC14_01855 [Acidobacteriaceae bacterium]